jgi:HEAT repeat protein
MSAEAREEQREAQVAARIAELRELSTKTDRGSLDTLLSELRNPQPEIREAALDIISESGNRGAIPGLIDAAAQTEDEGERQAITKAIEFLQLPTLTETLNLQRSTGGTTNRGP